MMQAPKENVSAAVTSTSNTSQPSGGGGGNQGATNPAPPNGPSKLHRRPGGIIFKFYKTLFNIFVFLASRYANAGAFATSTSPSSAAPMNPTPEGFGMPPLPPSFGGFIPMAPDDTNEDESANPFSSGPIQSDNNATTNNS